MWQVVKNGIGKNKVNKLIASNEAALFDGPRGSFCGKDVWVETESSKGINHATPCQDKRTASPDVLRSMLGGLQEG